MTTAQDIASALEAATAAVGVTASVTRSVAATVPLEVAYGPANADYYRTVTVPEAAAMRRTEAAALTAEHDRSGAPTHPYTGACPACWSDRCKVMGW